MFKVAATYDEHTKEASDYITALTPIMMKRFERLVKEHLQSSPPPTHTHTFDPFQFGYWPNHSTEDAISSTLHLE